MDPVGVVVAVTALRVLRHPASCIRVHSRLVRWRSERKAPCRRFLQAHRAGLGSCSPDDEAPETQPASAVRAQRGR